MSAEGTANDDVIRIGFERAQAGMTERLDGANAVLARARDRRLAIRRRRLITRAGSATFVAAVGIVAAIALSATLSDGSGDTVSVRGPGVSGPSNAPVDGAKVVARVDGLVVSAHTAVAEAGTGGKVGRMQIDLENESAEAVWIDNHFSSSSSSSGAFLGGPGCGSAAIGGRPPWGPSCNRMIDGLRLAPGSTTTVALNIHCADGNGGCVGATHELELPIRYSSAAPPAVNFHLVTAELTVDLRTDPRYTPERDEVAPRGDADFRLPRPDQRGQGRGVSPSEGGVIKVSAELRSTSG